MYFNPFTWTLSNTSKPIDDPGILARTIRTSLYQFKNGEPDKVFFESLKVDNCYAEFKRVSLEKEYLEKPPRKY